MHFTFYTKPGFPLCDEAESMLKLAQEDYPLTWTTIDIHTDDEIHEKYMLMIPVVEKDGNVLLFGNIGYADIVDLL